MPVLSESFNQVVREMCLACLPQGFDTSEEQTESFEAMREVYRETGRLVVNTLYSEHTIFGSPEVNWMFRAWHDSCHLAGDFPFTAWGEWMASYRQKQQLRQAYRGHPELELWCALVDVEVNGQVRYFMQTGGFPEDQLAFTRKELKTKWNITT